MSRVTTIITGPDGRVTCPGAVAAADVLIGGWAEAHTPGIDRHP
jgi:hypothetical protein